MVRRRRSDPAAVGAVDVVGNEGPARDISSAMNIADDRCTAGPRTAWAIGATGLDRWSRDQLDAATSAMIVLDHAGRVVATSPSAARWLGVAAWQLRGRELAAELRWALGDVAVHQVTEHLRAATPCATVEVSGRRGPAVAVDLVRGRDRVYLTLAL